MDSFLVKTILCVHLTAVIVIVFSSNVQLIQYTCTVLFYNAVLSPNNDWCRYTLYWKPKRWGMIEKNELSLGHFIKAGFGWKKKKNSQQLQKQLITRSFSYGYFSFIRIIKLSKYAVSFSGLKNSQSILACCISCFVTVWTAENVMKQRVIEFIWFSQPQVLSTGSHNTRNIPPTKYTEKIGRLVISIANLKVHVINAWCWIWSLQGEIQFHVMSFWSLQELSWVKRWDNSLKAYFHY